ncbi:phosphoenolpyruvate--protein phosphotransferase [Paenibacillus chitinolyticus]|uniref:Phosphoenolpyruvate-protein phosphotransferase n=1 Tax=Paenibacillus chitinolyticus TaxID=79263 RepID=A0A410WUV1_9BACL|nr:phosphoenolpyruvate--protein phosphotransferase [Paenibacillus chitinolyticus]MCY9589563.1 phosphoenolpyruvate--protein phosphotransferase [Paenibacillus chitinolyticus]MCY9599159.1 phosphoenolpyruvate--protein phosphotransferase [Paenibacillus chitinolyticus]QAV18123.1 phosphoenolpyruvate--protein phosphotransferase [Paenibacillus chitinolyticus]
MIEERVTESVKGIAAAPGYAMGKAHLWQPQAEKAQRRTLPEEEIAAEVARLEEKTREALDELQCLKEETALKLGEAHAEIFETHMLLLEDDDFVGAAAEAVRSERLNAEAAVEDAAKVLVELFENMSDAYMRERASDIRDVAGRLQRLLRGESAGDIGGGGEAVVLFAHDLTPSDTARLDRSRIAGFVTAVGGRTSHSAIMARSLEIPAVVGMGAGAERVQPGDYVIVDGGEGTVHINPDAGLLELYRSKQLRYEERRSRLGVYIGRPTETADGHHVELAANIGSPQDAQAARDGGAEGIGLYRTEFLYMGRDTMPTEEEQFLAYKIVAEMFAGQPVVIRTLDIGGDKELPYLTLPKEANPFLGYRAIRLCLDRKDLFRTQLRAILRASAYGNVKIMYPMISNIEELRQANAVLAEARAELDAEGVKYAQDVEVGIMIEVPAAGMAADQLAREADFFSIGTNDLVQYMMAADRMNETIAHLSEPFNPGVLRLIRHVITAAHAKGRWVGMCGEMAGSVVAIPLLLGMGLDEFSMGSGSVATARALMHKLNRSELSRLADEALELDTAEEIRRHIINRVPAVAEWL